MTRLMFTATAILFSSIMAAQAEEENILKKAQVGDWTLTVATTNVGGVKREMEIKDTVTARTEKVLTCEIVTKIAGKEMKNTVNVDLTEKFDPLHVQPGSKVKELNKGKEKIAVAGKNYDTSWVEIEITTTRGNEEYAHTSKVWTAEGVPLGGVVKMEDDLGGMGKMITELHSYGTK